MKPLKNLPMKRPSKEERQHKVLIGLIEHYLETGKPVGSNILKEAGFDDLSSATIRNYFAQLEDEGYLTQEHSSSGRIPTAKSFRHYAKEFEQETLIDPEKKKVFEKYKAVEMREIAKLLREMAEELSRQTSCAVFLSAPRFDNDMLVDIKVALVDHSRILCILVTDFGMVQTEVLYTEHKMNTFEVKRIEAYFHWRLTGQNKPANLEPEEELQAQKFYTEVMVRYLAGYSNFSSEDLFTTGFSQLLSYSELHDANLLAKTFSIFENTSALRHLIRDCMKRDQLRFWIEEDLNPIIYSSPPCSLLLYPYYIGASPAGAIGLLGPLRIPYRQLFGSLRTFSESVSEALRKNVYKFKLTYRQASQTAPYIEQEKHLLIGTSERRLLE